MTVTQILDKIGSTITNVSGIEPQYGILLIGLAVALYKPLRKGYLDNRLESFIDELDYSTAVLTLSFILAYYYQYGMGIGQEFIGIAGGFVLGTFVVRTFQKFTGFD